MSKQEYNVIGMMSGTSLDGIDLAHIKFDVYNNKWTYRLLETATIAYPKNWLTQLRNAISFSENELHLLNQEYTIYLGNTIKNFIDDNQIKDLDAVCSHGHTILHQPNRGLTLQIGNLPSLAAIIQQKVICDFRIQDVKLGGQGAPLVPIGDRILFSDYEYCLNLGGFSNISFEENNCRRAFDISPVNTVLNHYAEKLGLPFDDKGKMARSGNCNTFLLDALNTLDYYKKQPPKSLGMEFVNATIFPLIKSFSLTPQDILHTFTEHIAQQISKVLPQSKSSLLITGGGAHNDFLIERIHYHLPEIKLVIPDKKTLEFKEALIFGLLGVLKLRNEINVLSSVTGALNDHSSGVIIQNQTPLTHS